MVIAFFTGIKDEFGYAALRFHIDSLAQTFKKCEKYWSLVDTLDGNGMDKESRATEIAIELERHCGEYRDGEMDILGFSQLYCEVNDANTNLVMYKKQLKNIY
jgi:hypothetical protein